MKTTKLLELINSLNSREFSKLELFLKSNNTLNTRYLLKTYHYFKKHRESNRFTVDKLKFKRFVFGKFVEDTKSRLLLSDFSIIVEKFLVSRCIDTDHKFFQKLLLEQHRQRGSFKNYKMLMNKLKQQYDRSILCWINDYYLQADIESSSVMYKDNKFGNHSSRPYIQTIEYYDQMFILAKLHYDNLNTVSKSPLITDYQSESFLISEIISYVESNLVFFKKKHLFIYLEFLIYKLLREYHNYKYYNELLKYLKLFYNKMDQVYRTHIFYIFNTHLNNKLNIHEEFEDYERFVEVIKVFFSRNFFEDYGLIPGTLFYNCIHVSLTANNNSFAEEFYESYHNKIDPAQMGEIVRLSYIRILFSKNNFESALVEINKIKSKNFQIYMKSRIFLLMVYFEMGYIENVLYTIDALKHYINRHKNELGGWYESYNKFVYFLKKSVCLEKDDKIKINKVLKGIRESENFAGKNWLILKLTSIN